MKTKFIFCLLAASLLSSIAGAEPVMQTLEEQADCNKAGFFYDHSKEQCTKIKILDCSDRNLNILIKAKATNFKKWQSVHKQITASGYSPSQCFQEKNKELVVNYVRKGLWPEFKTVRVLTH